MRICDEFVSIVGIHVGDHFFSRCEMMAVGLHFHWLAGIDFLGAAYKKMMVRNNKICLYGCFLMLLVSKVLNQMPSSWTFFYVVAQLDFSDCKFNCVVWLLRG